MLVCFISLLWLFSCSVVSNSLWLHGLQPTRLLCPWDSPGKSTGVGCHCPLLKLTHTLNYISIKKDNRKGNALLFNLINIYVYIYTHWLRWVFVAERGLSPGAARGATLSSCDVMASLVAERRLQRAGSVAAGAYILHSMCDVLEQGFSPCPLHWQADS